MSVRVSRISRILLWLFVVNLGIALGAGLYESRIAFPQWLVSTGGSLRWNAQAARDANTGVNFWVYVTTVPLTLLTLANLVAVWRFRGAGRRWWLGAALIIVVERLMTFSYFIPTMVGLQGGALPEAEAVAVAAQWARLDYVRHALSLAGWLAALKALSVGSGEPETQSWAVPVSSASPQPLPAGKSS